MAPLAIPLMIAGTAMAAAGTVATAQAQGQAQKSQASIAEANAKVVAQQASQKQDQILRTGRQQIGEQSAEAAQSNTGMTGSNADMIGQSETNLSMDVLNAGYSGGLERTSLSNQAAGLRKSASSTMAAGWIGAGSQLLSGVGRAYAGGMGLPGGAPRAYAGNLPSMG